jgi:hypothetical protein
MVQQEPSPRKDWITSIVGCLYWVSWIGFVFFIVIIVGSNIGRWYGNESIPSAANRIMVVLLWIWLPAMVSYLAFAITAIIIVRRRYKQKES